MRSLCVLLLFPAVVLAQAKVERVYAAGLPAQFFEERYARLPELGRLTGRGDTANVEVVLQAKVDLIVDVGSTAPSLAALAKSVEDRTGIPYALLDGRLESTPASIRALGRLMGDAQAADQLASSARAKTKPLVYYSRGPAGLQTGGQGSINVEVLEFLGARNAAAAARAGLADARWRGVEAVKRKRVHLAPHLPFGWFDFPPGANRLLGVWWAGKLLHPEVFDIDLRAKVAEFHRRFYHREPSAAQLDSLLQ